jgi:hypothetical protein
MMIGRTPILAFGNPNENRQMLEYTKAGGGARLAMLVLHDDCLSSRREIAQALVIAGMVVMSHEGGDLTFEIAGQVIVLKQDAVLERLMPALDLALGLRVIGGAADVLYVGVGGPRNILPNMVTDIGLRLRLFRARKES